MKTREGGDHYALSPMFEATREADKRAFVRLMTWLRDHDPQNTVIMVQPENEVGSYGNPRDFGSKAQTLFEGPVPGELVAALKQKPGTWAEVFGKQADRAFNTWYTARYIGDIAAAGKAVKALPMYVNASLAGAFDPPDPMGVASGGPQQDVIDIWKVAAPAIDFAAPDIYDRASRNVIAYLDAYARPDNALMVPEIGNAREYARYFYAAMGRGAIGFSPFGMDATGYFNFPLGAKALDDETLDAFARKYAAIDALGGAWARLASTRPTWGFARPDDGSSQVKSFGKWQVTASYGEWQFGSKDSPWLKAEPPAWSEEPVGGALVLQLSDDEFLVTGDHVRLGLAPAEGGPENGMMVRVEEGTFGPDGEWRMKRVWNGDQTDYGLNFTDRPVWLKVTMGAWK